MSETSEFSPSGTQRITTAESLRKIAESSEALANKIVSQLASQANPSVDTVVSATKASADRLGKHMNGFGEREVERRKVDAANIEELKRITGGSLEVKREFTQVVTGSSDQIEKTDSIEELIVNPTVGSADNNISTTPQFIPLSNSEIESGGASTQSVVLNSGNEVTVDTDSRISIGDRMQAESQIKEHHTSTAEKMMDRVQSNSRRPFGYRLEMFRDRVQHSLGQLLNKLTPKRMPPPKPA